MNPAPKNDSIRIVTHRDVNAKQLEYVAKSIKEAL